MTNLPPKDFVSYEIIMALHKAVTKLWSESGLKIEDIHLEHPVDEAHGDYATNIALSIKNQVLSIKKENTRKIAEKIVKELRVILACPESDSGVPASWRVPRMTKRIVSKIEIAGPGFINFWLSNNFLLAKLSHIDEQKNNFGSSDWGVGKKWLVEHTSPNPNKALHLGHLRNNVTGMAIANTWEFVGLKTVRDCIDNNRGIAIAKLMWGYLKFAKKDDKQITDINYWYDHQTEWQSSQDRKLRPDKFIDELYTLAADDFENKKETEDAVRKLVLDWENKEPKNWELWKKVLAYSYQGQELTLKRLGNKWDKVWHEHEHYQMGKDMVDKGLKLGIFKITSEGTILTDLEKYQIPNTVVIKSDGTALYITQDLALTKLKRDTFHPDKLHWVIGPEQSLALKQMFAVCEQLGNGKVEDYVHIAYGYMSIKGKGKMSSRLGNVVYIDDLLDEARARIKDIMENARYAKLTSGDNKDEVAEQLAVGAVKYSILKVGRMQDIAFDFDESLSFEGNSGPYLQYTFARAKSVLAKSTRIKELKNKGIKVENEEMAILRSLYKFPEVVLSAAQNYAPNLICNYLYDLAQKFNYFYDKLPILKAKDDSRALRLRMTAAVAQVIKNGLKLLGIETPEKM
ncbi:arginine--tRNA ligase [Candidatus Gottesmanbacteria bacterium]|nr:arginine--tRNA ligase [Candidatus Gottesmanbacteria bacterium]